MAFPAPPFAALFALADTELLSAVKLTDAAAVSSLAIVGTDLFLGDANGEETLCVEDEGDALTGLDCSLNDSSFFTACGLAAPAYFCGKM